MMQKDHWTLFRRVGVGLTILRTDVFDRQVCSGELSDPEADPIYQGQVEECLMAKEALSKKQAAEKNEQ